jgi:hypothetical protein
LFQTGNLVDPLPFGHFWLFLDFELLCDLGNPLIQSRGRPCDVLRLGGDRIVQRRGRLLEMADCHLVVRDLLLRSLKLVHNAK